MENEKNSKNLINLAHQTSKSILSVIDNFILEIKNEKLKKLCLNNISEYDLIVDECKILMKSYNQQPKDVGFFEKYQQLISLKISSLNKKNTYEITKILYLSIIEQMPELYSKLTFEEDEISIIKKLIKLNEDFIENLKQFFVVND